MPQRPIRTLLVAEAANPDWVSVPLVGWSLARAIGKVTAAHLVTQVRNRSAILSRGLREGEDFTAIDSERIARPLYRLAKALRGGTSLGWTTDTAMAAVSYYYFEHLVWRAFRERITGGEFDLVHRITPLSPTIPSILAKRCHSVGVPFVLGPLNGGLPWPKGFESVRRREGEWLSYVRAGYRLMPAYRSTLRRAAAIIVGSRATERQIPKRFHSKVCYIPENGIEPDRCTNDAPPVIHRPLRACFVGRLVPYKGGDLAIEAAQESLRNGQLVLDVFGDGPCLGELRALVRHHRVERAVTFHGWVEHGRLQRLMQESQFLLFPSIREFGGGVVLEAMALGLVPIVADYGGPGEIVDEETGFKVPIGDRRQTIERLRLILQNACSDVARITRMGDAARGRAMSRFTWERKSLQIAQVYGWVLGHRSEKPAFFAADRLGSSPLAG